MKDGKGAVGAVPSKWEKAAFVQVDLLKLGSFSLRLPKSNTKGQEKLCSRTGNFSKLLGKILGMNY